MGRFNGLSGSMGREKLDPPSVTPADSVTEDPVQLGPDGTRSNQVQYYPLSEDRVEIANRVTAVFNPSAAYAESDAQKGGTPGGSDWGPALPIDPSNQKAGLTNAKGVTTSPIKLAYGMSDWQDHIPTFVGSHSKIQWAQNPNRPQVNPTPFNLEGPQANTIYSTPAPWAAGTFIG